MDKNRINRTTAGTGPGHNQPIILGRKFNFAVAESGSNENKESGIRVSKNRKSPKPSNRETNSNTAIPQTSSRDTVKARLL